MTTPPTQVTSPITIRKAQPADLPLLLEMIRALAEYEKLSHQVTATTQKLQTHLFGPHPLAYALLGFIDARPAGMAVYFLQFSTFAAAPVLYLEDLFVQPEFRGRGLGKALFETLLQEAKTQGCCRFEFSVLDWNTPSIEFYTKQGATSLPEWLRFRIDL